MEFRLSAGPEFDAVRFWDRRGLGTVRLFGASEFAQEMGPARLGPDALTLSRSEWRERCRNTKRAVKIALLDQKWVAGIGNLYASEILHAAGIHPQATTNRFVGEADRGDLGLVLERDRTVETHLVAGREAIADEADKVAHDLRADVDKLLGLERAIGADRDQQVAALHNGNTLPLAERKTLDDRKRVTARRECGTREEPFREFGDQQHQPEHERQRAKHAGVARHRHPTSSAPVARLTMRVTRTPKFSPSTTTSPSAKRRSPT
ncbi:MAG: hypothetical protein HC937_03685 [Aquincola sp.]|nr:hypothetical protein [Aquincola sp.]